jgi:hypothetical protein
VAVEVRECGIYGKESDIYSLGKIFNEIIKSTSFNHLNTGFNNINEVVSKMTDKTMKNRPTVAYILQFINKKTN